MIQFRYLCRRPPSRSLLVNICSLATGAQVSHARRGVASGPSLVAAVSFRQQRKLCPLLQIRGLLLRFPEQIPAQKLPQRRTKHLIFHSTSKLVGGGRLNFLMRTPWESNVAYKEGRPRPSSSCQGILPTVGGFCSILRAIVGGQLCENSENIFLVATQNN